MDWPKPSKKWIAKIKRESASKLQGPVVAAYSAALKNK